MGSQKLFSIPIPSIRNIIQLTVIGCSVIIPWVLLFSSPLVQAQTDITPTPFPINETRIHTVQRGENLYDIARLYGTTVEAITLANNIADPRFISVGQRLEIPNVQMGSPGIPTKYIVQPGDSLYTLAVKYGTNVDSIASLHGILNPQNLYVGEILNLRQGSDSSPLPNDIHFYIVKEGDTVWRICTRLGLSWSDLKGLNPTLTPYTPLWVGQRLIVPSTTSSDRLVEFSLPITQLNLAPLPAYQGQTLSLQFSTASEVQASGTFMGRPLNIVSPEPNTYIALIGVHALADAGIYPLNLILRTADGLEYLQQLRVAVEDGNFQSSPEAITIDAPDKSYLFDPALVQSELDEVLVTMSNPSHERYFEGLWALPSTGIVTSAFGTRRIYNNDGNLSFHAGVDFGGVEGSPVTAPQDGIVVSAEAREIRGNMIILDHGWGVYSGYWHLWAINVTVGQTVKRGDLIGRLGNTGLSLGPHLHWELWVNGVQVNPLQWTQTIFP